eukprot:gene9139-16262_t
MHVTANPTNTVVCKSNAIPLILYPKMDFDTKYEFDAPQFYNFNRTSLGNSQASLWFDQQEDAGLLRSPLAEVTSNVLQTVETEKPGPVETTQAKKSNIVTSWGGASTGKRVRMDGSALQKSAAPTTSMAKPKAPPNRSSPPVTRSAMKKQLSRQLELEAAAEEHAPLQFNLDDCEGGHAAPSDVCVAKPADSNKGTRKQWKKAADPSTEQTSVTQSESEGGQAASGDVCGAKLAVGNKRTRKQWNTTAGPSTEQTSVSHDSDSETVPPSEALTSTAPARSSKATTGAPRSLRSRSAQGIVRREAGKKTGIVVQSKRMGGAAGGSSSVPSTARFLRPIGSVKPTARAGGVASKRAGTIARGGSAGGKLSRALHARKVMPARSTKPLTLPDDIEFQTAARARPDDCPSNANKSPFKSLATQVQQFQNKTPVRFRTKPGPAPEHKPLTYTEAKEPLLWTTIRTRPTTFKSREEREEEEMASQHKFKAMAINEGVPKPKPYVSADGDVGPSAFAPTEFMPFHFVTDDRADYKKRRLEAQRLRDEAEMQGKEYKANPLNKSILDGPAVHIEETKQEFKALPMPDFLHVPKGMGYREPHPLTQPRPFQLSTEVRGKQHEQTFKAKLTEMEAAAEEARKRKAQPIGASNRHTHYIEHHTKELQMKEELERAEAAFKARVIPRTHQAPFSIQQESDRPLTVPLDQRLTTESRAAERGQFDRHMEEKMRAGEAEKQRLADKAAKEEQRERLAIRRAARFKARPMPDYSKEQPPPPPASKPLTNAVTPKLGNKRQRVMRNSCSLAANPAITISI